MFFIDLNLPYRLSNLQLQSPQAFKTLHCECAQVHTMTKQQGNCCVENVGLRALEAMTPETPPYGSARLSRWIFCKKGLSDAPAQLH